MRIAHFEAIDTSEVETHFLGHSCFGDTRSVLSDLFYLIREGQPPESRFGLEAKSRYGSPYWLFRP